MIGASKRLIGNYDQIRAKSQVGAGLMAFLSPSLLFCCAAITKESNSCMLLEHFSSQRNLGPLNAFFYSNSLLLLIRKKLKCIPKQVFFLLLLLFVLLMLVSARAPKLQCRKFCGLLVLAQLALLVIKLLLYQLASSGQHGPKGNVPIVHTVKNFVQFLHFSHLNPELKSSLELLKHCSRVKTIDISEHFQEGKLKT